MESPNSTLCCGCLCTGRKMYILNGHQNNRCFFQIIDGISAPSPEIPQISLCWECKAHINKFSKFTEQVKTSYKLFLEYVQQPNSNILLKPYTSLTTCIQPNIGILPPELITEELKTEDNTSYLEEEEKKLEIKQEEEDVLQFHSDDESVVKQKIPKKQKTECIYKEIVLEKEGIKEERRIAMLNDDYQMSVYKCNNCILSFPNNDDLKDHIHIKHDLNASKYKCKICKCSFSTEVSYNYHTNKHTKRYQCIICDKIFINKRNVIKHYEDEHYQGTPINFDIYNKIHENGEKAVDNDDIKENSTSESIVTFPCEFCNKVFKWKTSLRKHMETHRIETGQKRKPYCETCRISFTTSSNLQKHVKTSSRHRIQLKLRKFTDYIPTESASPERKQARIEEITRAVNNARKKYPCAQCGKKFQWRGNLLRHVNSHIARATKQFVCEPCNRTFSSIATYQQHMKISKKHVTENDFKYMCSDCGKKFANKIRLKDHIDWEHLKNYVHVCESCQKVFKSQTSLYLHKQVVHKKYHSEHLCDHCGKPFPTNAKLRLHIKALHSEGSAYKCKICSASFSWNSCLSRHIRKVHRDKTAT